MAAKIVLPLFSYVHLFLLVASLCACSKKPDIKSEVARLEKTFSATDTNTLMGAALSAIHKDDYAGGIIALDNAKHVPGMSAEQLMSVQSTMQAITADLVARAARGDATAQAQLAAIERSRSQ
jgi:hypothetical protein